MQLNQVTLPCTDYDRSVGFYTRLGLRQIVDAPPRYARFECPVGPHGGEPATLSLHLLPDWPGTDWPLVYLEVEDLGETHARLTAAGVDFETPPESKSWLWEEADLRDPAGNLVRLYHAGPNRRFPPWRVEGA